MFRPLLATASRLSSSLVFVVVVFLWSFSSFAQSIPPERPRSRPPSELTGWADWEKAAELLQRIKVPAAPPLSPAEAMKTLRVAPGYRLELVAAEPMVQNPIFFEFDPEGRIWVVEYQGYMRDLQGHGEGDPICRIVVLEDLDEDGRADQSTVFLDKLVMPRSLAFVKGGMLVAEPPKLWFCEDTNGDLRCDRKTEAGTYGRAGNPQHTANGLRYGLDNWLHSSDWPKRHRFRDGKLIEQPAIHRGQFGVTFDDFGRFMTCYESSALHADLIPAEYLLRNPSFLKAYQRSGGDRSQFGVNVNIARTAQEVFPIRVTPQITLGALELRPDGRLRTYTVVSGSCFYNGDQFPDDAYGNVFIPEAGGHLIGRLRLSGEIELNAARFYPPEQEFLASTDERFRPVNSRIGPDGALYIADMYHGIIEHVIFMVPYLERQVKERGLEDGLDMGRIYRVVSEAKPINRKLPRLSQAPVEELAECLNHRNGWWRTTAQRLLVERRDPASIPVLRTMALTGTQALGRLHALWTLDGLEALDWKTALAALDDPDEKVRATAVRLCEGLLASPSLRLASADKSDQSQAQRPGPAPSSVALRASGFQEQSAAFLARLERLADEPSALVRLQALLALGVFQSEPATTLAIKLVAENEHPLYRAAAMTGVAGRELLFLTALLKLPAWVEPNDHRRRMIALLSQAVIDEANPAKILHLLDRLASSVAVSGRLGALKADDAREHGELQMPRIRDAILDGMLAAVPRDLQNVRPILLTSEPAILTQFTRSDDEALRQRAFRLHAFFTWPGAPNLRAGLTDVQALGTEHRRMAEIGEQQFAILCLACHQPHGGGLPNVAPPLSRSEWVTGAAERLARIVLHGLYGPIDVNGQRWDLHMPSFAPVLDDEQIAGVLTYIRRSWGNAAEPVTPGLVTRLRQETASRTLPWTVEELAQLDFGQKPVQLADQPAVVRPDEKGDLQLPARLARTYGRELAYRPSLDILAPWRREQDVAEWRVEVPREGVYELRVTLAADDASAGDKFVVESESSRVSGVVESSGGYDRFREYACGRLHLRSGPNRVLMRPDGPLKRELADVRALRLTPVRGRD